MCVSRPIFCGLDDGAAKRNVLVDLTADDSTCCGACDCVPAVCGHKRKGITQSVSRDHFFVFRKQKRIVKTNFSSLLKCTSPS